MFLAKWKDTVLLQTRISMEIKHLLFTKYCVLCIWLLQNLLSSQESIVGLSGLLEYREGTHGEHFWTINQILVHQSNLCNVNSVLKSKVVSLFFVSVICSIIYLQILHWKCFTFLSVRTLPPDLTSRKIVFLKRMDKHL